MARTLLERADTHRKWIGDDHGDRYEDAILSEIIPDEMHIVTKELLDHLRAALDYCAREVWEVFSGSPNGAKIYFPIARAGASAADYASFMNKFMPGVPTASPDALRTFKSFQEFSSPDNYWLPDLATLANEMKHEQLTVASVPSTTLAVREEQGVTFVEFGPDDRPKRGLRWYAIRPAGARRIGSLQTGDRAVFLYLRAIQMELSQFLADAVTGVERVIEETERLTT
jgi:hypothetical protein